MVNSAAKGTAFHRNYLIFAANKRKVMSTVTISPAAYAQAEAYAATRGVSLSEAVEQAIANLPQGERTSPMTDNPSPSGDPWWDDPQNVAKVDRALEQKRQGLGKVCTREEIRQMLGL